MYHLFMHKREPFMERYHGRSNIETAYSMIKGKFGSALRSKSDTGQVNEALCKVLCHNIWMLCPKYKTTRAALPSLANPRWVTADRIYASMNGRRHGPG
jgi:hypothetical protein